MDVYALTRAGSWTGTGLGARCFATGDRRPAGPSVGANCEDTAVVDGSGNGSVRSDGNRRGREDKTAKAIEA